MGQGAVADRGPARRIFQGRPFGAQAGRGFGTPFVDVDPSVESDRRVGGPDQARCAMDTTREVKFGIGLETDVVQVGELLAHAHFADQAGLDIVSLTDHPYFAERIDAYAALAFVLGATDNVTAAVIMTNLFGRPAPILARTAAGLSTMSKAGLSWGSAPADSGRRSSRSVSPGCRPQGGSERWTRRSRS